MWYSLGMEKRKSIQVSEACWRVLKQAALDDGVTVREVVERLARTTSVAVPPVRSPERMRGPGGPVTAGPSELTYEDER